MRILLVNYEYPPLGGGAGNATANIGRELAQAGHDITVLTSRFRGQPARESVEGIAVRRVRTLRRHIDRSTPFEMVIFLLSASVAALRVTGEWRPDVAIAFFGIPCGPIALLLRVLRGIPYIVSLRGGDVPGSQPYDLALYHKLTGPFIHMIWRKASATVANGRGLRELAAEFAPDVDLDLIPNGIDTDLFRPPDRPRRPDGEVHILFVGRLVYQKGVDVLLEALAQLPGRMDFKLTVIGHGEEKKALQAQAVELGLAQSVDFLGWIDRSELPEHYRFADLFVLPSRGEGMSNVLLEAMASGLPVIVARTAADKKLIRDGLTGRIVRENDPDALRQAIIDIGTGPEMGGQLGKAARDHLLKNYTWRRTAADYVQLVESALGEAGTSGSTHESRGSS